MFSYNPLWKTLIDKNINKTTLANNCNIARHTIAKMGRNEYVDLKTLDKICNYLQCDIEDIIKYVPDNT